MFEWLANALILLGAISTGVAAPYQLYKYLSARPTLILWDFFSYTPEVFQLPEKVGVKFFADGMETYSLYAHELIIKNETGEPLSDASFIHPPRIKLDDDVKVFSARLSESSSTVKAHFLVEEANYIAIKDLVLPIDGSFIVEVLTDQITTIAVEGVHSTRQMKYRNYSALSRNREFTVVLGICFFIGIVIADTVGSMFINNWRNAGREFLSGLGLLNINGAMLFFALPMLFAFLLVQTTSFLRPSTYQEKKFSRMKTAMARIRNFGA